MFLFVCLCIKVYVCMFVYFCIYHSIQRFELSMAEKIADIDSSISAISTKVTDIDSSLDKNKFF